MINQRRYSPAMNVRLNSADPDIVRRGSGGWPPGQRTGKRDLGRVASRFVGTKLDVLGTGGTSAASSGQSDSTVVDCFRLSVRLLHEAQAGWCGEPAPHLFSV